ncbi:hypothetical protein TruAng_004136 [Truncatella angustata]|nr:hypothetical protein TruAng_004136 [Truncatella angustata]
MGSALQEISRGLDVDEGMIWTGPIFPGDKPTRLTGTVEDVYAQIMAINPNYDPDDSLEAETRNITLTDDGDLPKPRYFPGDADFTKFQCGNMATGQKNKIQVGRQGATRETRRAVRITGEPMPAAELLRHDRNIFLFVAKYINCIEFNCCSYSKGKSGSLGSTFPYTIWVGYANCRHNLATHPKDYTYPGGNINGACRNGDGR